MKIKYNNSTSTISSRLKMPVQGDGDGEILNGKPPTPYLPSDPVRRANLLKLLDITEDQLLGDDE